MKPVDYTKIWHLIASDRHTYFSESAIQNLVYMHENVIVSLDEINMHLYYLCAIGLLRISLIHDKNGKRCWSRSKFGYLTDIYNILNYANRPMDILSDDEINIDEVIKKWKKTQ